MGREGGGAATDTKARLISADCSHRSSAGSDGASHHRTAYHRLVLLLSHCSRSVVAIAAAFCCQQGASEICVRSKQRRSLSGDRSIARRAASDSGGEQRAEYNNAVGEGSLHMLCSASQYCAAHLRRRQEEKEIQRRNPMWEFADQTRVP